MARLGKAAYEIVYILTDGTTVSKTTNGAPPPDRIYRMRPLRKTGTTEPEAVFAARFMPSTQRWRLYDLRRFLATQIRGRPVLVNTQHVHEATDKDAVIMVAILSMGVA